MAMVSALPLRAAAYIALSESGRVSYETVGPAASAAVGHILDSISLDIDVKAKNIVESGRKITRSAAKSLKSKALRTGKLVRKKIAAIKTNPDSMTITPHDMNEMVHLLAGAQKLVRGLGGGDFTYPTGAMVSNTGDRNALLDYADERMREMLSKGHVEDINEEDPVAVTLIDEAFKAQVHDMYVPDGDITALGADRAFASHKSKLIKTLMKFKNSPPPIVTDGVLTSELSVGVLHSRSVTGLEVNSWTVDHESSITFVDGVDGASGIRGFWDTSLFGKLSGMNGDHSSGLYDPNTGLETSVRGFMGCGFRIEKGLVSGERTTITVGFTETNSVTAEGLLTAMWAGGPDTSGYLTRRRMSKVTYAFPRAFRVPSLANDYKIFVGVFASSKKVERLEEITGYSLDSRFYDNQPMLLLRGQQFITCSAEECPVMFIAGIGSGEGITGTTYFDGTMSITQMYDLARPISSTDISARVNGKWVNLPAEPLLDLVKKVEYPPANVIAIGDIYSAINKVNQSIDFDLLIEAVDRVGERFDISANELEGLSRMAVMKRLADVRDFDALVSAVSVHLESKRLNLH